MEPNQEKLHVEVEVSDSHVKRDAVLVFGGMQPAFIGLVERMGERGRFEAFQREASRRACLCK
jgi:hypothetical protein